MNSIPGLKAVPLVWSEVDNLFGKKKYTAVQTELLTKLVAWELRLQDPLPLPRKRYHFKQDPYNYLQPEQ